ncbi:hypothetical protein AG1IA_04170 [Rhizoctonia solani AG-1 IA]|uniref:Uncharacterized protein n=1 Tax=Thanatephorus cucumeris (strain AG1-IA) TaxID=983506 RepID=L8WUL9_THACA|nr:hypothetical protein AG1IA_04170 [Rhizoctonia solani AG-1 IA]
MSRTGTIGRIGPNISLGVQTLALVYFALSCEPKLDIRLHQYVLPIFKNDNRRLELEPRFVYLAANDDFAFGIGKELLVASQMGAIQNGRVARILCKCPVRIELL